MESDANGLSLEGSFVKPQFIYGEYLRDQATPYSVEINEKEFGKLLCNLGLDDETIEKTKISIERSALLRPGTLGELNKLTGNITLYTDPTWNIYQGYIHAIGEILQNKEEYSEKDFDELFITRRVKDYIAKVDPERADKFLGKLTLRAVNRTHMNFTALHELYHKFQLEDKPLLAKELILQMALMLPGVLATYNIINSEQEFNKYLFGGISIALYLLAPKVGYLISPMESGANKFAEETSHSFEFQSLVKIVAKNENEISDLLRSGE